MHPKTPNAGLRSAFYNTDNTCIVTMNLLIKYTAHLAIAELEERLGKQGRKVTVITQNIDRLHHRAGSKDVIELHGSLFFTRCTKCGDVRENHDSPIVPALKDKGYVYCKFGTLLEVCGYYEYYLIACTIICI